MSRAPRRVIFLGCEGESEQSYGALLKRLADEARLPIHIDTYNAAPAGDSLAIAEKVVARAKRKRGLYGSQYVMLDADLAQRQPDKARRAEILLTRERIVAIWQRPDHEGLLLRHFQGHERADPPAGTSSTALRRVWRDYHKNYNAADLQVKLGLVEIWRAAGVTPALEALLLDIGLRRP